MSLQNFIIQEELSSEYAERYILYKERYNTQILLDLKKALEKEWISTVNSFTKSYKISADDLEFAKLQNPNTFSSVSVEEKDEKLVTSRHRETTLISPSIKIPMLYKQNERDLMIKLSLDSAEKVIKQITNQWKEIFRVEKKGRTTQWFKVTRDHDEIRLQLALSTGNNEMYKTLYAIRLEYGKPGSKTRDFDRIYLISLM